MTPGQFLCETFAESACWANVPERHRVMWERIAGGMLEMAAKECDAVASWEPVGEVCAARIRALKTAP